MYEGKDKWRNELSDIKERQMPDVIEGYSRGTVAKDEAYIALHGLYADGVKLIPQDTKDWDDVLSALQGKYDNSIEQMGEIVEKKEHSPSTEE